MKKVLCIEDEDVLREDVVDALTDAGYAVLESRDGVDGLRIIHTERPDLIICDIAMPRLNGLELLQRLRTDPPTGHHIPVILVSAHASRADIAAGFAAGAQGYLVKPVDFKELFDLISEFFKPDSGCEHP